MVKTNKVFITVTYTVYNTMMKQTGQNKPWKQIIEISSTVVELDKKK
jgi:hypothetical protein